MCFFTITCENPSVISAEPSCNHPDMFITLTINNSSAQNIEAKFFASKLDPWIRIFNAVGYNWIVVQPLAFSNFRKVLYIDISNNQIQKIGPAFRDLKDLDFLNMSRNLLEEINSEILFISDDVNRLYLLDLSYNMLTYLHKKTFQHLYTLKKLYLQGNRIKTIQNECPKYLKSLDYLNLCCNNIEKLNSTLKYMKQLKELNLSFNKIKHINIHRLISMETIDLSHNKIKHFRFSNIDEIPHLKKLNLSYNQITKLSRGVAKRKVNIDGDIKNLIKLDFHNNKISYIDNDFFITFKYISYLILSSNKITKLDPGTFKNLKLLRFLDLSGNNLQLDDQTFKGLRKTEIIDISSNNISVLEAKFFADCRALTKIVANRNPIRSIDVHAFKKIVPKLTKISLIDTMTDNYLIFGYVYVILREALEFLIDVVTSGVLFLLMFALLFVLIYIGIYRRIICYYILKCVRTLMHRSHHLE